MAIMVVMPVVAVVPIAIVIFGASPERGLVNLFTLGAYGYLGSYILASASMPFFLRRIGESTYSSWILGAVTSVALGAVFWTAAAASIRTGSPQTLVYAGVLLASVMYATFLRLRLPGRLASVGIYDETRELDLFNGRATP
jgi:predicted neutral ceramidase superfamily lipid hydrolase